MHVKEVCLDQGVKWMDGHLRSIQTPRNMNLYKCDFASTCAFAQEKYGTTSW